MRFRIVCFWLSVTCVISFATGCQSSKFNMQKLAFWKNNDKLDAEYLEPPSHQFTPERTAVADSVSRLNKGEGPPTRPKTASVDNPSLDAFAEEVNRSLEELSDKTKSTAQQSQNDVNRALVDTANVSMPPTRQNDDDYKKPLTPRYLSSGNSYPSSDAATSSEASTGNFTPLAPKSTTPPSTRYEQLAQSSMPALSPLQPVAKSGTAGTGDFVPSTGSMPVVTTPRTPVALQTPSSLAQVPGSGGELSRMQNLYTPGLQPIDTQATPMAGQFTNNNPMASTGNSGTQYDSTPYKPFVSRNELAAQSSTNSNVMQAGNSTSENRSNQVAQIPATLQLSGQGTYAPGSVRRPSPLQPETMTAVPQSSGGSFMR